MYNIHFENKNRKLIFRFIVYGILGTLVAVATAILVLASQGYDLDRSTGTVIQNGLILVNSEPVSAEIFVNQESENDFTRGRLPLPAGDYVISLERDGYKDWRRSVSLAGSEVLWLYYPRLMPEEIVNVPETRHDKFVWASQSLDQRWLLAAVTDPLSPEELEAQSTAALAANPAADIAALPQSKTYLQLFDLNQAPLLPVDIALPENVSINLERSELLQWADDHNHVLIKETTAGGAIRFWQLNIRNTTDVIDLEALFAAQIDDVSFRDRKADDFDITQGDVLRRGDGALGALLSPSLSEHSLLARRNKNDIFAVSNTNSQQSLVYVTPNSETAIRNFTANDMPRDLAFITYDSREYVVVQLPDSVVIYRDLHTFTEGEALSPYLRIPKDDIDAIKVSTNNQFLSIQSGNDFIVHDFDTEKTHRFAVGGTLSGIAEWADTHRLGLFSDGQFTVVDFEGSNPYVIAEANNSFGFYFTDNLETAFTIRDAPDGRQVLQSAVLID